MSRKVSQYLRVCLLSMVPLGAVVADAPLEIADFTREYCRCYLAPDPVELENLTSDYQTLNKKHIARAMAEVPSQHKYEAIKEWSCSQNSAARAMILVTGQSLHNDEREYLEFVRSIPKSLGSYNDHRFDARFSYSSSLAGVLHTALVTLGIAGLTQQVAAFYAASIGLSTQWLKEYMNFLKHDLKREGLHFDTCLSDDFNSIIQKIQESILRGSAVIPMVIFNMQQWHYFNIVGFNNMSVVVLDTDAKLYIWSYELLKCYMNSGFHSDYTDLNEHITAVLATIVNQITPVNYFNLLLVTQT